MITSKKIKLQKNIIAIIMLLISSIAQTVTAAANNSLPDNAIINDKNMTFRDSGLYGGWNEYFVRKDMPFDFLIVQCKIEKDSDSWHGKGKNDKNWNDWLIRAHSNGKKVIACLYPVIEKDGEKIMLHRAYKSDNPPTVQEFITLLDLELSRLDLNKLYAITLGEENVYWNGQHKLLSQLYEHVKKHYDIPVYQWYSPGAGVPGIEWPNLKADGWIIDEYNLDQPEFEQHVRGYAIKKLPILSIIWAAPDMKDVPYHEKRFWEQYKVCRKYNIPSSYFNWTGYSNIWGWSENPPVATKHVFDLCKYSSHIARENPATCKDLDFVPFKPRSIVLTCNSDGKPFASYMEDFNRNKGVKFMSDARITGFDNLRWNSSPLQLWNTGTGKKKASLIYQFYSPFPLKNLKLSIQGTTIKKLHGSVTIFIRNMAGDVIKSFSMAKQNITESIPVNKITNKVFELEIMLTGDTGEESQSPAQIDKFTLTGELDIPANKQITLKPDALGNIEYTDTFDSLSILHTAEISNRESLISKPGSLQAAGIVGRNNNIEVVQKVVCTEPINMLNIAVKGNANKPDLGAIFWTGISLDGKTLLKNITSSDKGKTTLTIDTSRIKELSHIKQFYIHLGLSVNCGVKTKPVSFITKYTIKAKR